MTTTAPADASASTRAEGAAQAAHVPHRWRNLSILAGVSLVDNTEAGLVTNVFPSISASLGLTTAALGTISAAGKLIAVPAGPFWVWLSSKIGRRWTLSLTSFTAGLFGIGAGFSQSYLQLIVFTTLMAAAAIGASPISMAVISDSFPVERRPRAMGYFFASLQAVAVVVTPVIALFLGISNGWRWAMWAIAAVCIVVAILVLALYRDPGIGSSEKQLADLAESSRENQKVTWGSVLGLFRIPSYTVMMVSRLLSGHLLIIIFGVQFLVTERGIDNAAAVLIALPYSIGYLISTLSIGYVLPVLDRIMGPRARVLVLQFAQVAFAIAAFFATQIVYADNAVYAVLWGVMGFFVGLNPPVNRPIVSTVVLPELRGQAFAVWLTVFETIGWALFAIVAGQFAATIGLTQVFLFVLVGLMLVNAAFLTILYWTYPRDVRRMEGALEQRRQDALS
jgi:MFS family permease